MTQKHLLDYADWLDERKLLWPAPPKRQSVTATPSLEPLVGIRGVAFNIYGTLLRISDGELFLKHPQAVRMEIALEKTIKEFGMWNSMTRQPGAPWQAMQVRYDRAFDEQRLATTHTIGDIPEVDSAHLWLKMIRLLEHKEYTYDVPRYGTLEQFSQKIAFFFHSSLQGLEAEEGALQALTGLFQAGIRIGVVADGQCFTEVQMLRAFRQQGTLRALDELFDPGLETLSYREGIRKPSRSLYQRALERFRRKGIGASQVLMVGTRIADDLAIAKELGMRTVLFAADRTSLAAKREELADPQVRPDRLVTSLTQLREIVGR
ncbi:MAG TPA: HAD family hydrolase [Planctomycetaceae bacterium]|jgi:FMN phosphatase YigB (HAD superfamily)|nr:HAD family hydrolase [Planctomycetaceae bacterium]